SIAILAPTNTPRPTVCANKIVGYASSESDSRTHVAKPLCSMTVRKCMPFIPSSCEESAFGCRPLEPIRAIRNRNNHVGHLLDRAERPYLSPAVRRLQTRARTGQRTHDWRQFVVCFPAGAAE